MFRLNTRTFRWFLWRYLPLAALAGIRLVRADRTTCVTEIRYRWITRNPFGSIYFAALSAAAELSTGVPAFLAVRERPTSGIRMVVAEFRMDYVQQAKGRVIFTCPDVPMILEAVRMAEQEDEPVFCRVDVHGRDGESGATVASGRLVWRFRRKPRSVPPQ